MYAIGKQQFFIESDALHEKLHPRQVVFGRDVAERGFESLAVSDSVIQRNLDSEQHHGGSGILGRNNDFVEIAAQTFRRKAAQAVVGTEFQDNKFGLETLQRLLDPRDAAFGGFAANAGVDDTMFVP